MTHQSPASLLTLHGVRVLGGPSTAAIAERFNLPEREVSEHLLDGQAFGWVTRHDFFGETWSLTERGRFENERQLAAELDAAAAREAVTRAHATFLPLNRRHGQACTNWQLRPTRWDQLAFNDHTDPVWDDAVLAELEAVDDELRDLGAVLTGALSRFGGHAERHRSALHRVRRGQHEWLDAPDRPSCQLVWIQLHEDLLATLNIPRGADS
ncbi:MAG: transcriptional regulator [Propionicimonas sp.]